MERAAYDRMRELQRDHWWFQARRRILETALESLPLPAGARILEVGCGPGGNIGVLKRFGAVEAVEPDEESRRHTAEAWRVPVHPGLLPDGLPGADASYDVVAAFDVIEHVDDDAGSVRALARLLKPGGHLVTTVPAHPWMWSAHDARHHHKRRYTRRAYARLFEDVGLEVVKLSYFNTLLFPLIAGVRVAKTALKIEGAEDDRMPSPAVNRLLGAVMAAERHAIRAGALPFGVSLLLIARRP
jgi:SAM-dependent methyltransferase